MRRNETGSMGPQVVVGEMQDETICVRTKAGQVRRLWKDAPVHQRANFFDRVFAEMARNEPMTVDVSPFRLPQGLSSVDLNQRTWTASQAQNRRTACVPFLEQRAL